MRALPQVDIQPDSNYRIESAVHSIPFPRAAAELGQAPGQEDPPFDYDWEELPFWKDKILDLYRGILLQAVMDIQLKPRWVPALRDPAGGYDPTIYDRNTAIWWFKSNELYVFSVRAVCTVLSLDVSAIRKALAPFLCPALVHLRPAREAKITARLRYAISENRREARKARNRKRRKDG